MHAPGCANQELARLLFLRKVGEPPGDPNHQIGYDHDVVEICPSCNGATLETLKHDCFDFEEVWDQYEWYELSPEDGVRLRSIAAKCPEPLDPQCGCAAHKSLRQSASSLPSSSWDAVFAAMIVAWFRYVHLPKIVDLPAVAITIPVSLIVAGMLVALGGMLVGRTPPEASTPPS